jgi:hypothetical protein
MSPSQKFKSTLRSLVGHPLTWLVLLYAVSLTCSMAAMEVTSWATALFLVLSFFVDRFSPRRQLELHTLGIEFPLLALVGIAILGLRLNAPDGDFLDGVGALRNILLIFVFAYALQIVKNLNRVFGFLLFAATLVAGYAIWQHFTGIDLWKQTQQALTEVPWGGGSVYAGTGFFSDNTSFGYSFMMILALPWAALLLSRRQSWWVLTLYIVSFIVILTSLVFCYGRGVWLSVLVALPVMAFFASRKLFITTVIAILVAAGIFMKADPNFKERAYSVLTENVAHNEERKKLSQINLEMFHDHPWIGVGYRQNASLADVYYKKLNITDGVVGHAHSNYVELLSTMGLLGFAAYMLFILAFILMTARLFSTIPSTHYWHRVFALAALGAQIAFHVGGLTQWDLGDAVVQHQFMFWLAVVAYMTHQYYAHIVPDDHSL